MAGQQDRATLISETRRHFETDYLPGKADKYDSRDVERLQQDDNLVENYLIWRHDVVDDTLKMIDESFQWRKEYMVNDLSESAIPKWLFENGALYLHGYDKEGYKLFWFRVKFHTKDPKLQFEKKKFVAFWLEHYARREHGKPLTVVFDMAETGVSHIDLDFIRFIISCFKVYYPNYLSKIVIFEMPWIMNAAFKIVKGWLGPDAISMLKLTNKNEVQEYISAEYLPTHMGGTDTFKFSYPPLVDDDFQTPLCENGPITSEDETESKEEIEADNKEAGESSEEQILNSKKNPLQYQGVKEYAVVGNRKRKLYPLTQFLKSINYNPELVFAAVIAGKCASEYEFTLNSCEDAITYYQGRMRSSAVEYMKVCSIEQISKPEESDKTDSRTKNAKKVLTIFKGSLLHIRLPQKWRRKVLYKRKDAYSNYRLQLKIKDSSSSAQCPAEELFFGTRETGEKKCLIVLTNVTKNAVAFKVRTTAPDKYRVKPSNSSCEPGTSIDIVVSLHGGFAASLQDRFLIMAAEMDQSSGAGVPELATFWKEVPRTKVMEHRLRCHVVENSKPSTLTLKENSFNIPSKTNEDLHLQLTQLLQANKRLQEQIDHCIWFQQLIVGLAFLLVVVTAFCFYLLYTQRC